MTLSTHGLHCLLMFAAMQCLCSLGANSVPPFYSDTMGFTCLKVLLCKKKMVSGMLALNQRLNLF